MIRCCTQFDITRTGVRNIFAPGRLPFLDRQGNTVATHQEWIHARNQERNWETVIQLLSLRTQVTDLVDPMPSSTRPGWWEFEFDVDDARGLALGTREFGQLENDCSQVPMIVGLGEPPGTEPQLLPGANIVFTRLLDK